MATSAATLVQRARRKLRDWPEEEQLGASITSSVTSLTVADSSLYQKNTLLEIDSEMILVRSVSNSTTVTVLRGARGTTAVSHASSSTVLRSPRFFTLEILDALNAGIDAFFPQVWKRFVDTSLAPDGATYEFSMPSMPSPDTRPPIRVSRVEFRESSSEPYRRLRGWRTLRAPSSNKLVLDSALPAGTLRLMGAGPFPHLTATTDSLDAEFPVEAEDLLVRYACAMLLESGEMLRVRTDVGAVDNREQATRVGASLSASRSVKSDVLVELRERCLMPPIATEMGSPYGS